MSILKEKLHGEPEKLRSLSTAVNQLLLQICSCDGHVIAIKEVPQVLLQRVESILEGNDELISEFHSFLRKSQTVIHHQELAAGFLEKLRNYGEPVVNHFAEIMGEYKLERKKNPHDLFKKVRVTFYNYPDIEEEFSKFRNVSRLSRRIEKLFRLGGKSERFEMKRLNWREQQVVKEENWR